MRKLLLLALCLMTGPVTVAGAQSVETSGMPTLKVINFTADWCPNCRILNPRLDEAMERFTSEQVQDVVIDMTDLRGKGADGKQATIDRLKQLTMDHNVRYLWDWYGGYTGMAVIVAADNGEPLTCVNRRLDVDQLAARLKEAEILALRAPAGSRRPNGPDCPPPLRG